MLSSFGGALTTHLSDRRYHGLIKRSLRPTAAGAGLVGAVRRDVVAGPPPVAATRPLRARFASVDAPRRRGSGCSPERGEAARRPLNPAAGRGGAAGPMRGMDSGGREGRERL